MSGKWPQQKSRLTVWTVLLSILMKVDCLLLLKYPRILSLQVIKECKVYQFNNYTDEQTNSLLHMLHKLIFLAMINTSLPLNYSCNDWMAINRSWFESFFFVLTRHIKRITVMEKQVFLTWPTAGAWRAMFHCICCRHFMKTISINVTVHYSKLKWSTCIDTPEGVGTCTPHTNILRMLFQN